MKRPKLNYLAILVCAVIWWIVGAIWYSPALFGSAWMQATGMTGEMAGQMSPLRVYAMPLVAYLVACYVLAHAVAYADARTAATGAMVGFWNWLGFIAAIMFVTVGFQNKPMTLWFIDAGYDLVGMLISGILIAVWKPKPAIIQAA
jgi:hypothetical protein